MRWTIKEIPDESDVIQLADALKVDRLIATLLIQRGINTFEEAKKFFRPEMSDLHDPFLMKDMDKAVERIERAIRNNENILVYGDYDVDGTTAVSLLSSYLRSFYPNIATYIPDRYSEGYGISMQSIDFADDNNISLIVALDCGIKSVEHINYALGLGIDYIICDHHRPGDILPKAVAVLDPKRDDCQYPYKELCGCGVGFKLIQALNQNAERGFDLSQYLDLVAIAIAADIVSMTGENRVLVHYGLKVINECPRAGIMALTHNLKNALTVSDVVFVIAPRINAAGRIKHGNSAVALLTEMNFEDAQKFAADIELYNTERKGLDQQITAEALGQIEENGEQDKWTTVVFKENWHKGVIGIVASRLTEVYHRPTLVFTQNGDNYAASGRSVRGFDLYNALEACSEHLEQFGGHTYAAGMTMKKENFDNFKEAFENIVSKTMPEELREPEILVSAEIDFKDITPKTMRLLKQFEPYGPGNMTPVFLSNNIFDTGFGKKIGTDESHLKLFVKQGNSEGMTAIGFGLGDKFELIKNRKEFRAAYSVEENLWNGTVSLQLRLRDIKAM